MGRGGDRRRREHHLLQKEGACARGGEYRVQRHVCVCVRCAAEEWQTRRELFFGKIARGEGEEESGRPENTKTAALNTK